MTSRARDLDDRGSCPAAMSRWQRLWERRRINAMIRATMRALDKAEQAPTLENIRRAAAAIEELSSDPTVRNILDGE